jgi:hypothetical protein
MSPYYADTRYSRHDVFALPFLVKTSFQRSQSSSPPKVSNKNFARVILSRQAKELLRAAARSQE